MNNDENKLKVTIISKRAKISSLFPIAIDIALLVLLWALPLEISLIYTFLKDIITFVFDINLIYIGCGVGTLLIILLGFLQIKNVIDNNKLINRTIALREDHKLILYLLKNKKEYIDLKDIKDISFKEKFLKTSLDLEETKIKDKYGTIIITLNNYKIYKVENVSRPSSAYEELSKLLKEKDNNDQCYDE